MASKTNVSDYRFSIFINNDQAKQSLIEMEKVMQGYEADLKSLEREGKKNTTEYAQRKKAIDELNTKMVEMRKEAGLQALSIKELRGLQSALRNEMSRLVPGTEHWKKLNAELGAVSARYTEVTAKAKSTSMSLSGMANGFNKYFGIMSAGIATLAGFAFSIKELISRQAELSDSLANIRKTTGMTMEEVEKLNSSLGKLNTRTSRQELREMAVVAGQLGISKDQIYSFVESVDKLNVSLGDEISGGAEEVAKQMGTLRNVLLDMRTADISQDMLRIGNAVNELGAAGFATAPVVVDFANRIGGLGIPLGLTSDEVLGLSATMQELNVSTERGGTAITKILQKMTTNTGDFARIAGMDVKEFTSLVNTDLFGAFTKVLEGSKRGGQSATLLSGIIKELEVSGAGAAEVFSKLGNNTSMLTEKVALSGQALQGTDSIMQEFNIKNATLGAALNKLSKDFYTLITLPGVTDFFKSMVGSVIDLVAWFKNLPEWIEKYRIQLITLTGVIGVYIAAKTRSIQVAIMNNLTLKEGILVKMKDAVVLDYLIIKEELHALWKTKATVATKLLTSAQIIYNNTIAAGPIGAFILAITALVSALKLYETHNSRAIALEKLKISTTALLANANNKLQKSYSEIADQMRKLSTLSAEEKRSLQENIELKLKAAEAELMLMEAKQKAVGKQAAHLTLWQAVKVMASGPSNQQEKNDYYAWKNQQEAESQFQEGIDKLRSSIAQIRQEKVNLDNIMNSESNADKIVAKTIEALQSKLEMYQTALRNATIGSEEYVRIQEKIKSVNKELSQQDQQSAQGKKNLETEAEKLSAQLQEYIKLLEDTAYRQAQNNSLDESQIKADAKQAKLYAEKIARLKKYKESIDSVIKSLTDQAMAEMTIDRMPALSGGGTPSLSGGDTTTDQGIMNPDGSTSEPGKAVGVANPEPAGDDIWQTKALNFLGYADTVMSNLNSIDQLMASIEQQQLQRDTNANEEKKKNLKKQLDAKLITQKQYDAGVAKLDLELDAKKRKIAHDQAVRSKALGLVNAIIGTAQAVVTALYNPGGVLGIVLAALVGILGGVQIGLIASQPIPEAFRGRYKALMAKQAALGNYDVLGQDDKKLYRGVPFVKNPASGEYSTPTLFAESGNEIILNPAHTRNLKRYRPDLLKDLMDVPQRSDGSYSGVDDPRLLSPSIDAIIDPKSLENIRNFRTDVMESFIRGTRYAYSFQNNFNQQQPREMPVKFDEEFTRAIKEHTEALRNPKPTKSYIVYHDLIDTNKEVESIEADVSRE